MTEGRSADMMEAYDWLAKVMSTHGKRREAKMASVKPHPPHIINVAE